MNFRALSIFGIAAILAAANLCAVPAKNASKKPTSNKANDDVPSELRRGNRAKRTAATFAPERTTPAQRGEFQVNLVIITFPDCIPPESSETVRESLSHVNGGTISDYYKDYSQGITWPVLAAYPAIYMAPQPLGYYCRHDTFANPLGFKGDGGARAAKLRSDALAHVKSSGSHMKKAAYTCYVYCKGLNKDPKVMEKWIRPHYPRKPTQEELERGAVDKMKSYNPSIPWADPLWPNSIPQVHYPGNGGAIVHELGHCLGSPDYYHASEEHDGVSGAPSLPWSYGPTGPAYCRAIHHAFVPIAAYPKITKPGDVTLGPRSARYPKEKDADALPLGVFVPSSHPNYLFYIEYCHDERGPVGHPDAEGLLVHVINVTMTSPMMGPPDLCYTYRSDDPDHKAVGKGSAYLHPGDSFNATSDPAAILPNLLPAGIEISDIRCSDSGTCTFKLDFPPVKLTRPELDFSLLPQTELVELSEPLPTSFRATLNVRYRGEPLLTEYGFCYGLRKDPTEKTGRLFPLHHRDRYDARIIDLKPGVMYYVRAYARNANGIRYSSNQKGMVLPPDEPGRSFTATLFGPSDHLLSNWYVQKWHFGTNGDNVVNSANPIFAFMALANYYREMPGASVKSKSKDAAIDLTRVHSHPTDSRPKFRMSETEKLYRDTKHLLSAAGLSQSDFIMEDPNRDNGKKKGPSHTASSKPGKFGKLAPWVRKCAAALGVKTPEAVFFPCKDPEDINKLAPEIRRWILMSQPVLVVRENMPMNDQISTRWPLDIAIIDGLGYDAQSFHVVFPGGKDRGTCGSGEMALGEILRRTTNSVVMFYRPGQK